MGRQNKVELRRRGIDAFEKESLCMESDALFCVASHEVFVGAACCQRNAVSIPRLDCSPQRKAALRDNKSDTTS